jgi:hypothetical protein
MSLVKTEKGRSALLNRELGLSPRERQILLMADGKRTRQELLQFFVTDITQDLKRLTELSLLIDVSRRDLSSENLSATGTFRSSKMGDLPTQSRFTNSSGFGASSIPAQLSKAGQSTVPSELGSNIAARASVSPKVRRSMAAAKMYMVDILQRMRDMDSPTIAVAIQTSQDEADLAANLINACRYIHIKSGGSFGTRVYAKLHETIPEQYLLELESLAAELGIPMV